MRGEGEKQIEYDRRMVKRRIDMLEKELGSVRKRRDTQRKSRLRSGVAVCAIVGYTNGGKSTLLNALTGSKALSEDKLFATLDPLARRLVLPDKTRMVISDTVGFVRKLPHTLVEAFKSTLEEALLADFLILLLDASSPYVESHYSTTMRVLSELGAENKDMITVFNKCDRVKDDFVMTRLRSLARDAVFISCVTRDGFGTLLETLERHAKSGSSVLELTVPASHQDVVTLIHSKCRIYESEWLEDGAFRAVAGVPREHEHFFARFVRA